MKDVLKQTLEGIDDKRLALSAAREYLQARILQMLQDAGAFQTWIFHGGTLLRFLYRLPRYSEDLDFALREVGLEDRFVSCLKEVKTAFLAEGYAVDVKVNVSRNVKNAFVRFPGLLYELGLSGHSDQVLPIKVEVDTNPPARGTWATSLVRRYVTLHLAHYDKPSLLAGKLHALLARPYVKGRDLYDLVWYLSDRTWPAPNLLFLNNALIQTGWQEVPLDERTWKPRVMVRLDKIDWQVVRNDVEPFLERKEDLALLSRENVLPILKSS